MPEARQDIQALVQYCSPRLAVGPFAHFGEASVDGPRPTGRTSRLPERRSSVAVSWASFQGRRREGGVSVGPSRTPVLCTATSARITQGLFPVMPSQTNTSSQPAASAS
jgi:hypothetical protein